MNSMLGGYNRATLPLRHINAEPWSCRLVFGCKANDLELKERITCEIERRENRRMPSSGVWRSVDLVRADAPPKRRF